MAEIAVEKGEVIKVEGNEAVVKLTPGEECEHCDAKILCHSNGDGTRIMRVKNQLGAKVGDLVDLEEKGNLMLGMALMQFGLPLLGMVAGMIIVYLLKVSLFSLSIELTMALAGAVGIALGGVGTWFWSSNKAKTVDLIFEIISINPS